MKIFFEQCPLCLADFASDYEEAGTIQCRGCGGSFKCIGNGLMRAMTRQEFCELRRRFPVPPASIKESHDRIVKDMWG